MGACVCGCMCVCVHVCVGAPRHRMTSVRSVTNSSMNISTNHIYLKIGLGVMQKHTLHRTCFGQYQASSAALGIHMQQMRSHGALIIP